jgi:hypothetical protein
MIGILAAFRHDRPPFCEAEGHIVGDDKREPPMNPAQSQTSGMSGNSMRENRETTQASGSGMPDRLESGTNGQYLRSAPNKGDPISGGGCGGKLFGQGEN